MNERRRALELLRRIERESAYASLLLSSDSAFVRTLVLGVLRWRSRLDFVIDAFAKGAIESEIRDILRLGALQLLFMRRSARPSRWLLFARADSSTPSCARFRKARRSRRTSPRARRIRSG